MFADSDLSLPDRLLQHRKSRASLQRLTQKPMKLVMIWKSCGASKSRLPDTEPGRVDGPRLTQVCCKIVLDS